jgi:hypothetical protein
MRERKKKNSWNGGSILSREKWKGRERERGNLLGSLFIHLSTDYLLIFVF